MELEERVVESAGKGMESDGEGRDNEGDGGEDGQREYKKGTKRERAALPGMEDKEKSERGCGGEGEFGFREEDEGVEEAGEEESDRSGGFRDILHPAIGRFPPRGMGGEQRRVKGKQREKGEEKAAREFVGIRGKEIVIAGQVETVEGEQEDESTDGKGGGEGRGDAAQESAESDEGGNPEGEIEGEEGVDGGASEDGEEGGVGVDGDGTEVVGEVTVEDIAAGDAPGEVEFAGEVDVGIRPGEPGEVEHDGGEDGVKEKFEREAAAGRTREKPDGGAEIHDGP